MIFELIFSSTNALIYLTNIFNNNMLILLLVAALLLFLFGFFMLSDSNKNKNYGSKSNAAISSSGNAKDAQHFNLKKGFDILIAGEAKNEIANLKSSTFAVTPMDFIGISPIPKVDVVGGDEVKAGQLLFFDKKNPRIHYTSPVSGEVVEVSRGDKRAIKDIVILADNDIQYKKWDVVDPNSLNREEVIERIIATGCWPFIKQRPYNLLADPNETPKGIFISCFDSAPLAPDYNFTLKDQQKDFQSGIDALKKLSEGGKVHLGLNGKSKNTANTFTEAKGVNHYWFSGKHPAGNVGIQIHHIDPILKGEIVWTVNPEEVITIGKAFNKGIFDPVRTITVSGPEVKDPKYFRTRLGANVEQTVANNLKNDHVRIISGDVLTGKTIEQKGYLGFFDNQVSVVEEGDKYELFGWLIPSYMRPSISRTFPAALRPGFKHKVNTNTHGEHRAFVETGQYEKVLPMDLYPVHLLKSILANDFDKMEGLGIYEVVEEDLALCEFVCTSKTDVQQILRRGLTNLIEQG